MDSPRAMFLMSDELYVALNGKFTVSGVYTGDIVIAGDEAPLNQIIILIQLETPVNRPLRGLRVHVTFPGDIDHPRILDADPFTVKASPVVPDREIDVLRIPFLIPQPILRPGPIKVKIVHSDGELVAGTQWVVTSSQLNDVVHEAGPTKAKVKAPGRDLRRRL